VSSKKLKHCSDALIAKTCYTAQVRTKQDADSFCRGSDTTDSQSCKCNGQYHLSQCDVDYDSDRSCEVTASYSYYGNCDDKTLAPTPARGLNSADVFKAVGECKASKLDKICLKSKLTAKMNAHLDCGSDQCSCQGEYSRARCFSIPVNQGPVHSVHTPYCYYFAKHKYDGHCANPTASPIVSQTASPSVEPTSSSTPDPAQPTAQPTEQPSANPTASPTAQPTASPTAAPMTACITTYHACTVDGTPVSNTFCVTAFIV
jgi:PT repeat